MSQEAIKANLRHIMGHEAKPFPIPLEERGDGTRVTRGFEKVAFPKIVSELRDPILVIRQKALLAARDLLVFPINLVQCIAAGLTPATVSLLQDADVTCRERAAATLGFVVVKELGARDLIQHGGVAALVQCLTDTSTVVRENAYTTLIEACRFDCARVAVVALGYALQLLLQLVMEEDPGLQALGLRLMHCCLQARHNQDSINQLCDPHARPIRGRPGLRAVPCLGSLLAAELSADTHRLAAEVLGLLASDLNAKMEAVQVGCVPLLVALLDPSREDLATAGVTALMAISVVKEAKEAVVAVQGGLAALVQLLLPANQLMCVNAMICITNVAENSAARPLLAQLGVASKLHSILETAPTDLLRRAAAEALRECRFQSWPYEKLPLPPG